MKTGLLIALTTMSLSLHATDFAWDVYKRQTLQFQGQIPGWCNAEKAEKMMNLIYSIQPEICVEIGVFGGSSIYPTAKALKYLKKGVVYAIDPWTNDACLEGYAADDPNYQWWGSVNLEDIFLNFTNMLKIHQIAPRCNVLRMSSREALSHFANESIDILHVDGNHTEASALADVQMFVPKLKKGGYLWFDDANWGSTSKAVEYLSRHLVKDEQNSNSCYLLFRKVN
ncbi:MAG: class I SAM-dependent methyltransferase [Chlamydiota bacterium]